MGGMMKKYIIFVSIISLIIALTSIIYGVFPITYDQGRDWLWVKNQFDLGRPSLVGPAGSIRGIFFGPLWFWLLAIPYGLTGGSPLAMTLFNAVIVYASIIVAALIFYKYEKLIFWFIILFGFTSPVIHGIANHAFSQHLLPILTLLFIYALVKNKFAWAGLIAGLMWHAEPPIAVFSVPLLIYRAIKRKISLREMALALLTFAIPFLPLLVFDWRHDWIQLHSILSFIGGDTRGLQEIARSTLWQRVIDRPEKILTIFQQTIFKAPNLIAFFVMIIIFDLLRKVKTNRFIKEFIHIGLLYIASLIIIFIFYPHEFKLFYLDGFRLLLIIFTAIATAQLWKIFKNKQYLTLGLVFLFLLNMTPISFIRSIITNFKDERLLGSLFINQLAAVDWIYEDAQGKGFKVYTFVPAIYDYNWQYIIMWRGLKKYGYLPEEFSYWPKVQEYVPYKNDFLIKIADKVRPADNLIYYIMTSGSAQEKSSWEFGSGYPKGATPSASLRFPDSTIVEKFE